MPSLHFHITLVISCSNTVRGNGELMAAKMNIIYKYKIDLGPQNIEMPKNAKILSAHFHSGGLFIWAAVDFAEKRKERRKIIVIGTGQIWNERHHDLNAFIGTIIQGAFVWHVFEENGK